MTVPGCSNPLLMYGDAGAFQVSRSLRFNSSDSALLSRVVPTAGSLTTWTWAGWVKRSSFDTTNNLFAVYPGSDFANIRFANQNIDFGVYNGGSYSGRKITTAVFRDPSAWYHIVATWDTTNGTAADRMRLYVNGVRVDAFSTSTNPGPSATSVINTAVTHRIGTFEGSTEFFNGYLANVQFIDGQALTPSSFTEVSATTGQLIPKAYTFTTSSATSWSYRSYSGTGSPGAWSSMTVVSTGNALGANSSSGTSNASVAVYSAGAKSKIFRFTGGSGDSRVINVWSSDDGTTWTAQSAITFSTLGGSGHQTTGQYAVYQFANGDTFSSSAYALTVNDVNSFYLQFADNSSNTATTLGKDTSGNGNNWTPNNFSVISTSGPSYTPTSNTNLYGMTWENVFKPNNPAGVYSQDNTLATGTLATSKAYSSSVELLCCSTNSSAPIYANGVAVSSPPGGNNISSAQWRTVLTGSGTLTSVGVQSDGVQRGILFQIRVDGTQLVNVNASECDSLVDTPTSIPGTNTGVGGEIRGNYCVFTSLGNGSSATPNSGLSNGNLQVSGAITGGFQGSFAIPIGKWYWEITAENIGAFFAGVCNDNRSLTADPGVDPNNEYGFYINPWINWFNGSSNTWSTYYTTGETVANGGILGIAIDATDSANIKIWLSINNTWFDSSGGKTGNPSAGTNPGQVITGGKTLYPYCAIRTNSTLQANFGQRAWAYTAPTNYQPLVDTLLPTPLVAKPNTLMDVALYTGNGSTQSITGLAFSPDLLWIKARSAGYSHLLADSVRGPLYTLQSDGTSAEQSYGCINSFDSAGFTVDLDGTIGANNNGTTFVAWTWDAGTSTVSNTAGSITSQVRANVSAGFSVATWAGTGSGSATVGHGLGVAPRMMIVKDRSNARNWLVYHTTLGASSGVALNSTGAASGADAGWWNNSSPTSTVATIGTYGNESANYVGYFFTPVVGYSSFGSYVGNGSSDGPMMWTGMRPRFLMIKRTDTGGSSNYDWMIYDTARDIYNLSTKKLTPNSSVLEGQDSDGIATDKYLDILSNGFKIKVANAGINGSPGTFIYAAFAEAPFQYARAR